MKFRVKLFRFQNVKDFLTCSQRFCHTNVSKVSSIPDNNERNPFKTVKKYRRNYESELRIANRVSISILGNGAIGQPQCLCVFTDFKCYMFNCGESSLRNSKGHGIEFLNARHAFITERVWKKVSGLSDVYLTQNIYGSRRLTLHGPPKIELFLNIVLASGKKLQLVKRGIEFSSYEDDSLHVEYVPFFMGRQSQNNVHQKANSTDSDDHVMSYICKIKPKPGDLSMEKCIKYGVPVGPLLLKLKNGEDVTLPSGQKVCSQDVLENFDSGFIFLVIDVPYESLINSFVNETKFTIHQTNGVFAVFHFSPPHVVKTFKYQNWIQKFPLSTLHIFLNSDNSTISNEAIHELQHVLHSMHSQIFPLLQEKEKNYSVENWRENYLYGDANLQFHLRPKYLLDRSKVVRLSPNDYIQRALNIPDFRKNLELLKEKIKAEEATICRGESLEDDPEIVFLGTSSSTSTACRNVSAILIHTSSQTSVLLDCGEGVYMQLLRFFGYGNISSVLQKISCIFISHHHNDHYFGLFQLVRARKEAFLSSSKKYVPVAVVTTKILEPVIRSFHYNFEPIRQDIRIFTNDTLVENMGDNEELTHFLGKVELQTVPVTHCAEAYGLIVQTPKWKITYSGDCSPTQALIEAGNNCDLLIHEASIDDDCLNEAAFRNHSTPMQAIDIGRMMNAKNTILTHFSKRYLVAPIFPEMEGLGCAFDNMTVRLSNARILPLFVPTLKSLFSELLQQHQEKGTVVASIEKVFWKNVKNINR